MKYCVYQVTNNVTGKIYVGAHATMDVNDYYRGSGPVLHAAIKKHGSKNFSKEILAVFDNENDMFAKEASIVNEAFVADRNTYNIKVGGKGGIGQAKSEAHKKAISKSVKKAYVAGLIKRRGGRPALTPNIQDLVIRHGFGGAAKILDISYDAARSRYYRMVRKPYTYA